MKPKLAMYWASSCGGCEIAVVNLHGNILEVDAHFDFMFCPCLLDTKKAQIESLPDGSIELTLFDGAIRTSENEEMAHLMRKKSRLLVAFGSCACEGGIPGLSNLSSVKEHFENIYSNRRTTVNPESVVPLSQTPVREGSLRLPSFYERVKTLDQIVDVDYFVPGCPPETHQISAILELIISGKELPPKGSTLGAGNSTVCSECVKKKSDKKIGSFARIYEVVPDPERCLLEQGIVCMGMATRDGCGAPCPKVEMPCIGCYGPPEGIRDQGAKLAASLGSMLDIDNLKGKPESDLNALIDERLDQIPDETGTAYKFSLPGCILKGKRR